MKTFLIVVIGILVIAALGYFFSSNNERDGVTDINVNMNNATTTEEEGATYNWPVAVTPISHATALLEWGDETIYTDPVGESQLYVGMGEPTLILLTDIHSDHLSTSTLEELVSSTTELVAPQAVADLLPSSILERTTVLENGATTSLRGFTIEAVPMYNVPETDDSRHPKGRGNGYVLEREGTRVYVAGDTAGTPEMRNLEDIDIAFIPMNLPFTMSVEEAAQAVLAFAPRTVYPYHYRGQDGLSDVERFRELVNAGNPAIEVRLEDWYEDAGS